MASKWPPPGLAITANNLFKFSLIASLGGSALARRCLPTLLAASGGMLARLLVLASSH
jgi:Ser/Thr protein kinase RdoA (MazF antagonist)